MSDLTDQHLLRAWAERADEDAFGSLAARYSGFIHGAALRRVGDTGLAEEITQDVFAALSRKARTLMTHPTLAGWLHRTAMLTALDRLRRRAARTKTRTLFSNARHEFPARSVAEARPHLDEALDCLGARDREVLMLHFAERRTFPEIAEHLGSTADAVRMRANRALVALSRMLGKKGAVIPAAALGTGLCGTFAQAVPASLAALAPAALGGLGKVSALSVVVHAIQTMKTAKAIAGTTFALVLSAPLVFQQSQIVTAEAHIAALKQARDAAPPIAPSETVRAAAGLAAKAGDRAIDFKQLGEDALDGGYFAMRRIRETIARLDNNNLTGLIETILHAGMMPAPREQLLAKLLGELRQRDPALFIEWSMKVLAGTVPAGAIRNDYAFELRRDAASEFRAWMAAQPAQAAAWAEANGEAWKQFGGDALRPLTAAGLPAADPPRAYAMLEKMPVAECMATLGHAARELSAEQARELAKWAVLLADVGKRRRIVRKALFYMPVSVPKDGSRLEMIRPSLLALSLNDDDLTWVAARLALDSIFHIESDLKKVPTTEIAWLENLLPADRIDYAKGALGHAFNPTQALIFLNAEFDKQPNDDLIAGYVESEDMRVHRDWSYALGAGRHGETAFRLATRVQDPQRRAALLAQAWRDLHKDSAQAARRILAIPELNADDRAAVEAQVAPLLEKKP